MLQFLKKVFNRSEKAPGQRVLGQALADNRRTPVKRVRKEPGAELDVTIEGGIEERGPGKNVLKRKRFVREEAGTHETLKIVDETVLDTGEESGIDPYNTGSFDRSRNWDKRFRL